MAEPDAIDEPSPTPLHPPLPRGEKGGWLSRRALLLLVVAAAITGFFAFGRQYFQWDYVRTHLDTLHAEVESRLLAVLLLYFLLYLLATALSLPIAGVLSLLAGALFGRWLGTGVVILAASLGATAACLGSRYLFRDWVQSRFGEKIVALDRGVEREGAYYLFALRLVPLFPFFLINLGMGLTRMRLGTFFWVSFVGMLPGTFLYVNAGTVLSNIEKPGDVLSPGVIASFALLGLAPLLFRKVLQWSRRAPRA